MDIKRIFKRKLLKKNKSGDLIVKPSLCKKRGIPSEYYSGIPGVSHEMIKPTCIEKKVEYQHIDEIECILCKYWGGPSLNDVYIEYYERTGKDLGIRKSVQSDEKTKKNNYNRFDDIEIVSEAEEMKYYVSLSHKLEGNAEQTTDKYEVAPDIYIKIEKILKNSSRVPRFGAGSYMIMSISSVFFAAISFTAAVAVKDIYVQNNSPITLALGLALCVLAATMTVMVFVMGNKAAKCIEKEAREKAAQRQGSGEV
jgi:hypothetical protein